MARRKIYFRADASAAIGYGHFIRTLALADMLKDDFDCTFFTQSPTEYQKNEVTKVCQLVALPADNSRFMLFLDMLYGNEIVVLDNYFFTTDYQRIIKEKGCKLVCIDDMHDKHYYADVVINHGIIDAYKFDIEPYTQLCLGLSYALLRKPFHNVNPINYIPNRWFISFGGADPLNLTEKYLSVLEKHVAVKSILIVIGDAYQYADNLIKYKKCIVKKNLTAKQMVNEMSKSEYAIVPSSSVCIEALACGCKIATGYYVNNQREFFEYLLKSSLVYPLNALDELIDTSFVDDIICSDYTNRISFLNVQNRYINLFRSFE